MTLLEIVRCILLWTNLLFMRPQYDPPRVLQAARICVEKDFLNGFEIIENADVAYVPAGNSDLSGVAALSCAYIKFKVNPYDETTGKGIKPGNAVIGLYDKTKNKILWSWHIWFTDESFSTIDLQYTGAGAKESHLNCALGWTPPISFTGGKTVLREQYVMIVCTETDKVVDVFKVRQALYDEGTFPSTLYTPTYYQRGRKDPFLPGRVNGDSAYNRPVTSSEDPYDLQITSTSTAVNNTFAAIPGSDTRAMKVAWMIRNPYSFLAQKNVHPDYLNLWNATSAVKFDRVTSPAVTKSVYDPSPRGFRLPRGCSYYGTQPPESIYKSGVLWKEREAQGAEIPSGMMLDRGYRNYSSSGAASPVFFPAVGYRHRVWPGDVGGLLMDLGPAGSCKGYYWTSISEGVGGSSLGFASTDHQLVAFEHEYAFCVRPVAE